MRLLICLLLTPFFCLSQDLQINLLTANAPSCKNFMDGNIEVEGVGGLPPYEYSINGGDYVGTNIFDGLDVGEFEVTVRDSQGDEATVSTILESEDAFDVEVLNASESGCSNDPSSMIEVLATDPNDSEAVFTFSIDGITFQESGLFENVVPTFYNVLAQNAEGCIQEENIFITALDVPEFITSSTAPSCVTANDGSIQIVDGLDATGVVFSIGNVISTDGTFSNLGVGMYGVTATASNGCETISLVQLASDIDCEEEEELCPLLQNRIGMRINKWDTNRYSLRFNFRNEIDEIESCTYEELFEMIYFHLVTKSKNSISSVPQFQTYCQDMEVISEGDFTPLTEKLQSIEPSYDIVENIELIQSFIITVNDGECIKI